MTCMCIRSHDYRDIGLTLNSTLGPSQCHIPCILVQKKPAYKNLIKVRLNRFYGRFSLFRLIRFLIGSNFSESVTL